MKYPRYPRHLNDSCKLTNRDIRQIQSLRKRGWMIIKLAKKFHVVTSTIHYWLIPLKERSLLNKIVYQKYFHPLSKDEQSERSCRYYLKKKELQPAFMKWQRQKSTEKYLKIKNKGLKDN